MTNKKTAAGIIGAGISGLTVAYALQKRGIPATVYEKAGEVGGVIRTVRKEDWLVEEGPNTLMANSGRVWNLLDELHLGDAIIEADSQARRRFIARDHRPVALPASPAAFLRTPLLSTGARLRLLKEPFVGPSGADDESIAAFIRRRLGQEPLDYGVNPFVSGVYAGDPKKLSIKHTFSTLWEMEQRNGSLLKGLSKKLLKELSKKGKRNTPVKKKLISFTGGNQMLPAALARALEVPVRTSCEIASAKRVDDHWKVSGTQENQSFRAEHEILIPTIPAGELPSVFESRLFHRLSAIPYVPMSVLCLGFNHEQIKHPLDGYGLLTPEVENHAVLGMLFSSTLFPDRAPEDHHLLTCFVGGARQPHLAHKSRAELLELLLPELKSLLGAEGNPVFLHHSFSKRAIPQYEVGYERYLSAMTALEEQCPGLLLGGNYRHGVSVPDCIHSGFEIAERAARLMS